MHKNDRIFLGLFVGAMCAIASAGIVGARAQSPPNCIKGALVQSVTHESFDKVTPGETLVANILIENVNAKGCPGAPVILSAQAAAPFTWPVAVEGGAKWVIEPGAKAFTRLHIAVPKEASTGSYGVTYTLDRGFDLDPIVTPFVINVWSVSN